MKKVVILGATGSIGTNVLDVIRACPGEFEVSGLVSGHADDRLTRLAGEFPDADVAIGRDDPAAVGVFRRLAETTGGMGRFHPGADGPLRLLAETGADVCVAAVSGTAGLAAAFAAASRGMRILLANKEVLVSAGRLFMAAAAKAGAEVLPLDSEHVSLWQCLEGRRREDVAKLIITASGGPFRRWSAERMAKAAPADALKHPNWSMGAKISVDSATLANKALEIIEAHHLFGIGYDRIEAIVHPQSAVHGLAEMADGTLIAHLGICDMRVPIAYMLHYPGRNAPRLPRLDLAALGKLEFEKPDADRFPLLRLGVEAGKRGGAAVFNAANEAAVEAFLAGALDFPGIARAVEDALERIGEGEPASLDEVFAIHSRAREAVARFVENVQTTRA